jgi:hypothetical protein
VHPEDRPGAQSVRPETKLSAKLIPVHDRHEYISNHQIGTLGLDDGQSLSAVLSLEQSVAFITQERYEDFAVRREVVKRPEWSPC